MVREVFVKGNAHQRTASSSSAAMVTLHCTVRVLKRFRFKVADDLPPSTTVLGSWYANLLNLGRQRYVLCVSARTLLPVLVPARNSEFPARLGVYVAAVLTDLGVPQPAINEEVHQMEVVDVGRTQDRSILGVMNDFARMAPYHDAHDSPIEISLWLGDTPSGPLDYASPIARTCEAFSVPEPPRSW